jgi:hypothetical protein
VGVLSLVATLPSDDLEIYLSAELKKFMSAILDELYAQGALSPRDKKLTRILKKINKHK